jgi:DNA-binding beta-propeller fold protein YncE
MCKQHVDKCVTVLMLCLVSLLLAAGISPQKASGDDGKIVVANRNSGTLSVIDVRRDRVVDTVGLPILPGDAVPEPMYVVNTPTKQNRVWVGDRANDRVVVFNGNNFEVEALIPAGEGVFHIEADGASRQVWVVNDVDRTATVIDAKRLNVIATVPMPDDLGAPHDIVLDDRGVFAYITFLAENTVVQFETLTFTEVGRAIVGLSPHISYNSKYDELYLPCQGSNAVYVLNAVDLSPAYIIPDVPNAHGAVTSRNSKEFYTTNIADGGLNAIQCIDTKRNSVVSFANTPNQIPHNLALTSNGQKLYVTHSGPTADKVSVFNTNGKGKISFLKTVTVGTNPFGLAYVSPVKRKERDSDGRNSQGEKNKE